ncbi:MAG: YheC/YheD family protein [Bacillota bacterium]
MLADASVAAHIPKTVVFSCGALRLERTGDSCSLRTGRDELKGLSLQKACMLVETVAGGDIFLLQPAINMLSLGGRPFDTRVAVHGPYAEWICTGLVSRVAAPRKIVTNRRSSGTCVPFRWAFVKAGGGLEEAQAAESKLRDLSLRIATVLSRQYPGLRELGLDIGMDRDGMPWVFEVNTRPSYVAFSKLKNQSSYLTIHRYYCLICGTRTGVAHAPM